MDQISQGACAKVLYSLLSIVLFQACGGSGKDVSVKEYKLGVNDTRPEVQDAFRYLINSFNNDVGFSALELSEDGGDANSFITVTKGLEERDEKVGWGQWIRVTDIEGGAGFVGAGGSRVYKYSMKLEFDDKYITTRWQRQNDLDVYDLKKLFYHEVGHGLQMNHVDDTGDIMYKNISGNKSFSTFYRNVRNYFSD